MSPMSSSAGALRAVAACVLAFLFAACIAACGSKEGESDPPVAGSGAGPAMGSTTPPVMTPAMPATGQMPPPGSTQMPATKPGQMQTPMDGAGGTAATAGTPSTMGMGGSGGAGADPAGPGAEAGSGGTMATAGTAAPTDPSAPDPSPGCSGGAIKAGHSNETIMVGGRARQYVQHVPQSYDGKTPFALMLDFHGGTYDGPRWDARASNKFKNMSETEHFLYISPTGLNAWWTTTDGEMGVDGTFIRALIDKLKKDACIDNKRVYSTGCSMCGDMSFYMACYLSDVIAASLPMCGTMSFPLSDCKPKRPISVRFIMGSQDSLNCWMPPRTSVGNPCASEVRDTFKMLNRCTDSPEKTHNGLCETLDECEGGTEVSICLLNATHTGIYQSTDMDVYTEGWKFLKSYTLP